jgi:hypothetical protein
MSQLSVPSTLGFRKTVPWSLTALELRDALQENRLGQAAYQRLATDVNNAVRDVVSIQGTLVARVTGAPGTYDNIALADSIMNEQGVNPEDRYLALNTRDYNGLAGNLANRATMTGKPENAYERNLVGEVAGFETFKLMDSGKRLGAAAGGAITVATNGAQVRYVPLAAQSSVAGQINVDNRYQTITVSATAGVAIGDAFTIAGVNSVHMITKENTGQLRTFRVIAIPSGTTLTISPPIIGANSAPTVPEIQYKNSEIVSTSATAAITWLNLVATGANPFWYKDSIEMIPGRYSVPNDQGVDVMRGTTDQGMDVVFSKRFDPTTFISSYFLDTIFGVVNTNPQMNGVLLFNQ